MGPTFEQRLNAITWSNYHTAYGPAVKVPDHLWRLAGPDRKAAMGATHDLWCGLCHQHVQVGSAAVPALPFLLEVLDRADRDMTVELLDILLGFAISVSRQRAEDFQRSLGREAPPEVRWVAEMARFRWLAASPDEDVADSARRTLAELGVAPDAAADRVGR